MIKIKGLTEAEVIEVCTLVAQNHRSKQFDCFTPDDIEQQAWVIMLHKISDFDAARVRSKSLKQGLENWLNNLVSKRLRNFYRDNYSVKQKARKNDLSEYDQTKRKSLLNPSDISEAKESSINYDLDAIRKEKDLWANLLLNLDYENLDILESILSGEKINCYYKTKLQNAIKEIWEKAQDI